MVNSRAVERKVAGMLERLGPQGKRMLGQKVAQLVTETTLKAFADEADPVTGIKWPKRKHDAAFNWRLRRGKRVRKTSKQRALLVLTGTMKREARGKVAPVGAGPGLTIRGVVGQGASQYAETHQYGTRTVPRRRFMGFSREAVADAKRMMAAFVARGAEALG